MSIFFLCRISSAAFNKTAELTAIFALSLMRRCRAYRDGWGAPQAGYLFWTGTPSVLRTAPSRGSLRGGQQFNAAPMCKFRRANTVRPYRDNSTVQLFYGTSRTPSPTICADNLRLLKPPSDEGGGAALAVTEGEKREANKSCRKFGVASACIV